MFCTKCGQQIEDTSAFCVYCGTKTAQSQPAQPQYTPQPQYTQPQYAPQQYAPQYAPPGYAAPKKSKTGLFVGLSVGGVVLIAAVILLLVFVFPAGNPDIVGKWYDVEGNAGTIEFSGNNSCKLSAMGFDLQGKYNYNPEMKKGQVTISFFGETNTSDFYIENNILHMDATRYTKDVVGQKKLDDVFGEFDIDGYNLNDLDLSDWLN